MKQDRQSSERSGADASICARNDRGYVNGECLRARARARGTCASTYTCAGNVCGHGYVSEIVARRSTTPRAGGRATLNGEVVSCTFLSEIYLPERCAAFIGKPVGIGHRN